MSCLSPQGETLLCGAKKENGHQMENYAEYTPHCINSLSLLSIMAPLPHPSSVDTFSGHRLKETTIEFMLGEQNHRTHVNVACYSGGEKSKMCIYQ